MYFEYIIPEFLKDYKMLYIAVFGIYLSLAYWILIFLREQTFLLIRNILETIVISLGTILTRTYECILYVLKSPLMIIETTVIQSSQSFDQRKKILEILAISCEDQNLSAFLRCKLSRINHLEDLEKLEKSLPDFFETLISDDRENKPSADVIPVGLDFALSTTKKRVKPSLD